MTKKKKKSKIQDRLKGLGPTISGSLRGLFSKKVSPLPATVIFGSIPENAKVIESYPIQASYSNVTIVSLPELGGGKAYYVEEVQISETEKEVLQKLTEIISKEIEPPKNGVDPRVHLRKEARRLARKYGFSKNMTKETWARVLYYLQRDFLGFGHIHVIMNDPMIEDLSVNGVGIPVYVWHRKHESIPTNLTFTDEATLDNLIIKLTHLSNKHISTAFPILDAMLPGKDRFAATFRREVSPKGGSFTIRRFRQEPFSIIDLVELNTVNEELAAYFWMLIENRMTMAIIGGTGAGKTSTLNAFASLVKPQMKIVTVEEIPELNIPHENWVQLVSRESYGLGTVKTGEVTLFDLVKTSLRYRPDYIVVGEIRGEEAFVLFQALATGHGGLTTLHAESLDYAIKRLTSPPMNVSKTYVPLINMACMIERVQLPNPHGGMTFGRRLTSITEITEKGEYRKIAKWNPLADSFNVDFKNSEQMQKIALRSGLGLKDVLEEVGRRNIYLRELRANGIRKNVDMAKYITNYYLKEQLPSTEETPREKPNGG
jgi:flagellar protein FlaI